MLSTGKFARCARGLSHAVGIWMLRSLVVIFYLQDRQRLLQYFVDTLVVYGSKSSVRSLYLLMSFIVPFFFFFLSRHFIFFLFTVVGGLA